MSSEGGEGGERERFFYELLSSPHIIVADGDSSSLVNLSFFPSPLPHNVYGDSTVNGGEWGDYGSYLSFFVIICHHLFLHRRNEDGLSSVFIAHIVFSTNNTPPQHISNLYYLTPPSSSSSYVYLLFLLTHIKKRTRNFPHIPNNTQHHSFLSQRIQVHQSSLQRTPCRICTW